MGFGLGGMPMPSFSSSAAASLDQRGAEWSLGGGDWSVNMGGSGTALQTATGGMNWLLIAAAVGATWLLMRR